MSLTVTRHKGRFKVGTPKGRPNTHGIELTYQPGDYGGTCIRTADGWIARWRDDENSIATWSRTRKGAYSKAYRFMMWSKRT